MMKSALITGIAGFVGSHLAEHLALSGWQVYGLDDLSTGSLENLEAIDRRCPTVHPASVANGLRQFRRIRFDAIFHLAARVGVDYVIEDRLQLLREEATDTLAIVDAAHRWWPHASVLFTSSSEVYGARTEGPFSEDENVILGSPHRARWAYATAKLWSEHVFLAAHRQQKLRAVVVRLFNIAGPRQRAHQGCVIPQFVTRALREQTIEVHGDGLQERCFTDVNRTVRALGDLVQTDSAIGRIVNVGSTFRTSIRELAYTVSALVNQSYGLNSQVTHIEWAQTNPDAAWEAMRCRVPDIELLQSVAPWWEPGDITERTGILDRTIRYWHDQLGLGERE